MTDRRRPYEAPMSMTESQFDSELDRTRLNANINAMAMQAMTDVLVAKGILTEDELTDQFEKVSQGFIKQALEAEYQNSPTL